jgi:hypothetical protein
VLVLLIGGSIGLALALVARTQSSDPAGTDGVGAAEARFVDAASFDPFGKDGEHDDEVLFTIDGDPSTYWRTETYEQRDFGGNKTGVGIVLTLEASTTLDQVRVDSPTNGWSAEVFVADGARGALADWGDPVASADSIEGGHDFSLDGARGGAVLIWITRLGEAPHRVQFDGVTARS